MGRRDRECYLCGKEYQYCPTCSQDKMKPTWMAEFHDENCKNIFDFCTRFNMELMTKEEAKEALEKCDLSNKENFKSYVKEDIANIFYEEVKKENKPVQEGFKKFSAKQQKAHEVVNKTEE
jgi:tRNA G26 N,N-dimethylase Trm1